MRWKKPVDVASLLTIVITLILFVIAWIEKGFTHELLLEAGVFLVSVKLILMSYKNGQAAEVLDRRLDQIERLITASRGNT